MRFRTVVIMSIFVLAGRVSLVLAQGKDLVVPPPASFTKLFSTKVNGQPSIEEAKQNRFNALPAHIKQLFYNAAEGGRLASPVQLANLLTSELTNETIEIALKDNCLLCHTNPDNQDETTLIRPRPDPNDKFSHLDISEIFSDVHFRRGVMCSGCHGGSPTDTDMGPEQVNRWPAAISRKTDRSWIPDFCARCHSNPDIMRQFNPGLPVDQLVKYKSSMHGKRLLEMKDSKVAQCVSCHGAHGIRNPKSPRSLVNPLNVPFTCGKCHADAEYMKGYLTAAGQPLPTNQLEEYKKSVHGIALLEKKDTGAPACNSCHGNHAALPPDISHIAQVCRLCHVNNGTLFDGSRHKLAFTQHHWPECETCHGNHNIQRPTHEKLSFGPGSLCGDCHAKFALNNPECNAVTNYFRTELIGLADQRKKLSVELSDLAEKGMQVDDLQFSLASVDDSLVASRSRIHSFNRSEFDIPLKEGKETIAKIDAGIQSMGEEYQYRRQGLLVATLIISIFAFLLYIKIRQVDRQNPPEILDHD